MIDDGDGMIWPRTFPFLVWIAEIGAITGPENPLWGTTQFPKRKVRKNVVRVECNTYGTIRIQFLLDDIFRGWEIPVPIE